MADSLSDLHGHGALLKVLVDRTPAVADVEGDVIATRIFRRDQWRRVVGRVVDGGGNLMKSIANPPRDSSAPFNRVDGGTMPTFSSGS